MNDELETLFSTMVQLGKLASKVTQESIEEQSATMLQYSVLTLIQEQPKITIGEIGKSLHMSISSATQLVDRLAKNDDIERIVDESDRRVTRIVITESGEQRVDAIRQEMIKKLEPIFSKLSQEDRKELIRIHKTLIDALKE